jgi:predicted CXXCH cytochrome family protein
VYNTSEPSPYLAGGNFYWVADAGDDRDAAGHNVLGISGPDAITLAGEFAPGGFDCGNENCHKSLAVAPTDTSYPGGCQGCHLAPAHHADDSGPVVGDPSQTTDGYYRFLSGHMTGAGKGVCGIEDDDWQYTADAGNHNEYLGNALNLSSSANLNSLGNTMTGYCCGCHGNFHQENTAADGSGEWIRHPSDAVIPNEGEYADAFGTSHVYDPLVPVARPSLTGWTDPVTTVAINADMVMCLSCHRPHGSPYDDLLRWNYGDMLAGGGDSTTGCFACHTKKDTGG